MLTRQSSRIGKPKIKKETTRESNNTLNDGGIFSQTGRLSSIVIAMKISSSSTNVLSIYNICKDRVENPLSFFGSKDDGTDDASSQDWGGDFSSENGSGFDNFGSSDDGSRSTGFGKSAAAFLKTLGTPKDISESVPPFTADDLGNMNFTNFGVEDHNFDREEGFEATYNEGLQSDATTSILADINEVRKGNDRQKRKMKGLKGLFGKGEKS